MPRVGHCYEFGSKKKDVPREERLGVQSYCIAIVVVLQRNAAWRIK